MKIVIAPQEFKESLRGIEIAQAMREGVSRVWPDADTLLVPVADGGDGTLQSLVDASDGELMTATVDDPLGRPIEAVWGALGDGRTAVIEMARSSGLALLKPEERDPLSHHDVRGWTADVARSGRWLPAPDNRHRRKCDK